MLPWHLPRPAGAAALHSVGLMGMGGTGLPQAEQDGEHQEVAGGGCVKAVCLARAKPQLMPPGGEVRDGRRGAAYTDALLRRAGVGMGRDSSARGDREGTFASSHTMREVKASKLRCTFILVLCALLFTSRKLPLLRLKLQEGSRVPAFLMPLSNSWQQ